MTTICTECGQPIEGEAFGQGDTWRHPFSCPPTLRIEPTRYTVCGLPEDDVNSSIWKLDIERRGPDSWAICHLTRVWKRTKAGGWDYEPLPSSRTDHWKKMHRFTLEEAMELVPKIYATRLVINGWRVEDGKLVQA